MMEVDLNSIKTGDKLPVLKKESVSRVQLAKYAGASGDFNPLHLDDGFAQKIGMDGVIAHGMLVMGFLGQYVMEIAGNKASLTRFKMRFGKITKPEDVISCEGRVKNIANEKMEIELFAVKQNEEVVGAGEATLKVETRNE